MAREGRGKIRGEVTAKGQGVPSELMEMFKKMIVLSTSHQPKKSNRIWSYLEEWRLEELIIGGGGGEGDKLRGKYSFKISNLKV